MNKYIDSFGQVDFSGMTMPNIAVFLSPDDFPGKSVARVFDVDKPTNTVMVRESLKEIQEDIKRNTSFVFMNRGPEDVKNLVGVWL